MNSWNVHGIHLFMVICAKEERKRASVHSTYTMENVHQPNNWGKNKRTNRNSRQWGGRERKREAHGWCAMPKQNEETLRNQYIEALTIFIYEEKCTQTCSDLFSLQYIEWIMRRNIFHFCHFVFTHKCRFSFWDEHRTHVSASASCRISMKIYEVCLFHLTIVIEYLMP